MNVCHGWSSASVFVDPALRQRGAGTLLLQAAADEACRLRKHPILDVWTELAGAVAMYEAAGWIRLGEVMFSFGSACGPDCLHAGDAIHSFVYSAATRLRMAPVR